MDSLSKYNDPASAYYGHGKTEVRPDCSQDTIRSWFIFLYKIYLKDVVAEGKPQENKLQRRNQRVYRRLVYLSFG